MFIFFSIFISSLFLNNSSAKTINCSIHKIYCNILKVNPKVNKKLAMELSNYIYIYSKKFKTDPNLSIAIAMKESSIRNRNKVTATTENGKKFLNISDVGVFQIHIDTIVEYNKRLNWDIDFQRLMQDIEYQTYWHIRILKRKINICKKLRKKLKVKFGNEWSCYHSFTYRVRQIYLKSTTTYLQKMNNI